MSGADTNAEVTAAPAAAVPAVAPLDEAKPTGPGGLPLAFAVTWVSYASYYLGRKGISVAKATIGETLGRSSLYGVETVYLAAYAIGQYISGTLGDRVGARRLIGAGMLVSAAACAAFGLGSGVLVFLVAFAINGLAQSTGWPGNVKAMAEWTTPRSRGAVMGLWSTCYQVGGIVATGVAARLLAHYGWRGAFLGPALLLAVVGVGVLLLLRSPTARGGTPIAVVDPHDAAARERARVERHAAQRRVLRDRTVWFYGASYFGIKLIRYSFLLWLPFYLHTVLHYDTTAAADLSTSFEIGGIAGTIGLGVLSDRFPRLRRSVFAAASLIGLAGALWLYARFGATSTVMNFSLMALCGALLFGPDALLSGAAAQDAGGAQGAAIAAGVINALGSTGAILQELVTRTVSNVWGWNALFVSFMGFALLSALCLVPTFRTRAAAPLPGQA